MQTDGNITRLQIVEALNEEIKERAIDLIRQNSDPATLIDRSLFLLYGLELTQAEVGKELDCNQTTVSRQRDRYITKLAKQLYLSYHNLAEDPQISIDTLTPYIEYVRSICEDYYALLAIDLFTTVTNSGTTTAMSLAESIDLIESRWQFKFKPNGSGLSKVDASIEHRSVGAGLC
jgi:hypothetical protein